MNLPYSWLSDYTNVCALPRAYASRMTMTGSKVEGFVELANQLDNVVCGRITAIEKHPDADKLVVCQVDVGTGSDIQICTGATNLKVSDLCPVALHNSRLPGDIVIKKTKMRGVESNGMLCSIGELGLTVNDVPYANPDGILVLEETDAKPGDDIRPVLGLDEIVFEFEITPNRPDCLSVIGLARESAASFEKPLTLHTPSVKHTSGDISEHLSVGIEAPDLCPRYTAAMAKNIKIAPSPKWLRDRLRHSGIRPINNIVDITNYVMLEYGQPMHAFDYACLEGNEIVVRRCLENEMTTTLDGQQRKLAPDTLVIADSKKVVGIAGVMGGENSEITADTKMIVFESATFSGPSIRIASRKIGMRTEASGRFEKGLDCENTMPALLRACQLVEQLGAGEIIGGIIDAYPVHKQERVLTLDAAHICRFIGADISEQYMKDALLMLGFKVNGNLVTVPSWRDDVEGLADLAEEVARIYGYDKIEPTLFKGDMTTGGLTRRQLFDRNLENACLSVGYSEAITLSFISSKVFDRLLIPQDSTLRNTTKILNPLGEDQSIMRTTSLHSILEAISRNYNYRTPSASLFEVCTVYYPHMKQGKVDADVLPVEKKILTLASYESGDFYSIKGQLESIMKCVDVKGLTILPCSSNPSYHPGRCGAIMSGGQCVGYIGQIHPTVAASYDVGTEVYVCEADCDSLYALTNTEVLYTPLPKYPATTRDLGLLCDEAVTVLELETSIRVAAGKMLEKLELFDVYRGAQVQKDKKSVAYSLAFRAADHTLTVAEVDSIMSKILKYLEKDTGATLRM